MSQHEEESIRLNETSIRPHIDSGGCDGKDVHDGAPVHEGVGGDEERARCRELCRQQQPLPPLLPAQRSDGRRERGG